LPIHQDKTLTSDTLAEVARKVGIPADRCESIDAALTQVSRLALSPPPRILITGSLYLAGEVLAANGTPPA
jgi:dihydrofolate synthase / folylpolyglutamate synthase